jgi:hypothetical protein|tara:strand:- start:1919 stop:2527 length:609 start_codon:yes stop_codon:yes gene_type:complete
MDSDIDNDLGFTFVCEHHAHGHTPIPDEWDILANDETRVCVECFYRLAQVDDYVATSGGDHTALVFDEKEHYKTEADVYGKVINNLKEASMWLLALRRFNRDFHFDENPHEIINAEGDPLFTFTEAKRIGERLADIYWNAVDERGTTFLLFEREHNPLWADVLNMVYFGHTDDITLNPVYVIKNFHADHVAEGDGYIDWNYR